MYDKIELLDEMFVKMNEKVAYTEQLLAEEKESALNCINALDKQITTLKARKVRIFDWWIQLFTGKISW